MDTENTTAVVTKQGVARTPDRIRDAVEGERRAQGASPTSLTTDDVYSKPGTPGKRSKGDSRGTPGTDSQTVGPTTA